MIYIGSFVVQYDFAGFSATGDTCGVSFHPWLARSDPHFGTDGRTDGWGLVIARVVVVVVVVVTLTLSCASSRSFSVFF